jgi:predicted AlkP superfamily phosphohydrolase/phosphomutase
LLLRELPDKANVFFLSSVGMSDEYPTSGLMDAFMRQLGYQAAPQPGSVTWSPMAVARRLVPESWRIAASRHLSRARRERILAEQFRNGTDWNRTVAFAIPSAYFGLVRVNLRGREPEGIVAPGSEYRSVLDQLTEDLEQLIDPETGEKAVVQVSRTTELYDCEPHDILPDLFVNWKPGRYMSRVSHPRTELLQRKPDFFRRSDHSDRGFFAAAGPGIGPVGQVGCADVLDLAPTFLALLGQPVPGYMQGRPLAFAQGPANALPEKPL